MKDVEKDELILAGLLKFLNNKQLEEVRNLVGEGVLEELHKIVEHNNETLEDTECLVWIASMIKKFVEKYGDKVE